MNSSIVLIGQGRVGASLAQHLERSQISIEVAGRQELRDPHSALWKNISHAGAQEPYCGTLIVLAVPDGEIPHVVERLTTCIAHSHRIVVVHTAGAHTESILEPLRAIGCSVGTMHPFQTFPTCDTALLRDIPWGVRGSEFVVDIVTPVVAALGGKLIHLRGTEEDQALYHATAVMASNFQHVLYHCAKEMASRLGIAPEELLPPIVNTTAAIAMKNVHDTHATITGPAARGDTETLEKHRQALSVLPDVQNVYNAMTQYIEALMHQNDKDSNDS